MKRFWKIFGITFGALIALLLVVISVVVWLVFTPERLTPIVRQVADKVITCEHEIGEVDLTFFSTFPEFGLRAEGLYIIHPMEGAQSDTLLAAPEVVATVDVVDFIKHSNLTIHQLLLADAVANAYIVADGTTNFDVFALSADTTAEDTTAFSLPFNEIRVDGLQLSARTLTFCDKADSIDASLRNVDIQAKIGSWEDVMLTLSAPDVTAIIGETPYAQNLCIGATIPASVDLDAMHFALHKASLSVNEYSVFLDGDITLGDSVLLDMNVQANEWQIAPLLSLVPPAIIGDLLDEITVDGVLSLNADIAGVYSDSLMPVVDARVRLQEGKGKYAPLPYTLRDVAAEADAHIDLNDSKASNVQLKRLTAKTKETSIAAQGRVSELLADMLLDVNIDADVNLPDMAYFLPEDMVVTGTAKGKASARIRLSDLTNMRLERGKIAGDLRLQGIDFQMDSMLANLPDTRLQFQIPNPNPSYNKVGWLAAQLAVADLDFQMIETLHAQLGASELQIESGNILSNDPTLYAALALKSESVLRADMDSMSAVVEKPTLKAYAEYNTKDTTAIPTLKANLAFADLKAQYTDIEAHLTRSALEANLSGTRRDNSVPRLKATIQTDALQAGMGEDMQLTTAALKVEASARYNKHADNILLQWNPRLNISLREGRASVKALPLPVGIPHIDFSYSNKVCDIQQSQVHLGNSDFALSGEVRNIGKWLREKGTLEGELNFVSEHTDVNQLMALFSADEGSAETETKAASAQQETAPAAEVSTTQEANPFLVPQHVDLALNTHIKEAVVFNEVAHNLKGKVYIKDGILALEEMGFVCNAAKLQLTAMYKTPRRNHIYVGFDYHMIDVDIEELIHMIPQIDTMMPMLRSFKGQAEFHLSAETYTNAKYEIKPSTIRGAASLFAKDLVVLDSETFSKISKLLLFNKKTENKIDSIAAEMTIYKTEIDVYPLCVSMDNYMVALGGRHNLDMTFDYDINALSPIYLGVNVSGNMDNLKIKLAKCKYAKDFKPLFHGKVDTQSAELRAIIRNSMRRNVKIQTEE